MKSKRLGRRGFLKGGAALVGGLTAGLARPASGQESGTKLINASELRPVGEVSRFVKKIARRGSSTVGLTPHQDLHGIITPSELHFYENHENGVIPDIDPQGASSPDPRHGGPSTAMPRRVPDIGSEMRGGGLVPNRKS